MKLEIYVETAYYEHNFYLSDKSTQYGASDIAFGCLIMNSNYPIKIVSSLQISLIKSSQGFSASLL